MSGRYLMNCQYEPGTGLGKFGDGILRKGSLSQLSLVGLLPIKGETVFCFPILQVSVIFVT